MPAERPRVTAHNLVSLDGRLDGFPADVGLYYELAAAIPHGVVLTGSATILAAAAGEGVDMSTEDPVTANGSSPTRDDGRPWLVVVDSGGGVTRLGWLRTQPFWRDVVVLCSAATPAAHLDRLRRHGVAHHVVGPERVDLTAALRLLAGEYGIEAVRVDAGGALNGALLRAGLVDEISLVIAPYLVGDRPPPPRHLVTGLAGGGAGHLALVAIERLRDGHVWLRYAVRGPAG